MQSLPKVLTLVTLLFILLTDAQQDDGGGLLNNLDGEFRLVNLKRMLNISEDPSFLAEICPTSLTLIESADTSQFGLLIGSQTESSEERCSSGTNSSLSMTFRRVQPTSQSTAVDQQQQVDQQKTTIQEISDFFPIFLAFSPDVIVCPNRTEVFTQVVAQDIGYWYTLLNHYKSTGATLGSAFNETDSTNLNAITEMYTLSLAIDFEDGLGCTYVKDSEKSTLQARINEILETTPTSTPAPPSEGSDGSTCFSGDTKVELADGSLVSMRDLKVGDDIRDALGSTSKVLLFTHADPQVRSEFVILHTSTTVVALSATHYMYRGEDLLPAEDIKVGDEVTVVKRGGASAEREEVLRVERKILVGLYNPQTASGTILVSRRGEAVLASTYTTAVPPMIAHALLWPLRVLGVYFDLTVPQLSMLFDTGIREKAFVPSVLLGKVAYPTSTSRALSHGAAIGKQ